MATRIGLNFHQADRVATLTRTLPHARTLIGGVPPANDVDGLILWLETYARHANEVEEKRQTAHQARERAAITLANLRRLLTNVAETLADLDTLDEEQLAAHLTATRLDEDAPATPALAPSRRLDREHTFGPSTRVCVACGIAERDVLAAASPPPCNFWHGR